MSAPEPTWDHYRSFLSVLTEGSLSAAARRLGLTQPTLARHVEQLESALGGTRLFSRSPQGLTPTEAAERLRPHAETMAAAAEAMRRAAQGVEAELSGTVRISASEVIGTEVLPGILRALRAAHPGLVFELVLSNAATDLLRREADIAIRMMRPRQKALVARRAGAILLGLYAHPDYLARHGTPARPQDLTEHALIGFDRDRAAAALVEGTGLPVSRASFAYRIDSQPAQLAAIRAGCGIGICQIGLAGGSPALVRLLPEAFEIPLETWVTMHEDLRSDRRMRASFDHLHRAMSEYVARQGASRQTFTPFMPSGV